MVTPRSSARRLLDTRLVTARWLVLAPHADDETLGCGALIADAAARGALAAIVVLTDGAGSHPHASTASRARLIAARRREAGLAVRRLAGPRLPAPVFLDWPDAHPPAEGSLLFERSRRALSALCRRHRVDAVAVTAEHEPHCDHEAACRLALAVSATALRPLTVVEYLVWASDPPGAGYRALQTAPVAAGLRSVALAAHRSQLTPVFGLGFRLAAAEQRMPTVDTLYERIRHARRN